MPSGTVTFLFTDLEGSTRLWEDHPDAMRAALARHDEIVRTAIEAHDGVVVKMTGDGAHAAFGTAHDAIHAAVDAQLAVGAEPWDATGPLRVRMGVHTGVAELRDGDYYGSSVNRAARIMAVAHGGQVVVSQAAADLAREALGSAIELVDLGDHRLADLARAERVYQLASAGLQSEFPRLRSIDAYPGNLPAQLSSFVGREQEVDDVAALLQETRFVTLTGVGGVGKTRLALQTAATVIPRFPDGVWLVELAKVRDAGAVADAVAAALGSPNRPEEPVVDTLKKFLRAKRVLLVLDNCEHVLDSAADLVVALEQACPELVVLATSREGLGIRGEQLVAVRSLDRIDAEQLFVSRAAEVTADFTLAEGNEADVQEVCRRLDGIPLAIELAAARVAVLSPAQIAARLDQRFRLLAGAQRGAIERHATLRAAIDWSYDMLEPDEQLLLARLSVFAGGCTLGAAEAVCAGDPIAPEAVIDLVGALVTRSLVEADAGDPAETTYRLLETIRQYAEEQLDPGDRDATAERHARYYSQWLATAGDQLRGPNQTDWVAPVLREAENVRAAVAWVVERGNSDLAFAFLANTDLPPLFFLPAGRAVWSAADPLVDLVRSAAGEHLARGVAFAAWAALMRGDRARADALCDEALALDDGTDEWVLFDVLSTRNQLTLMSGDMAGAMDTNKQSVEWARRNGQVFVLAGLLAGLAAQHANSGEFDLARSEATEALEHARRSGDPITLAIARVALAFASVESDPDEARVHLRALAEPDTLALETDEPTLLIALTAGARLAELEVTLRVGEQVLHTTPSTPLALGVVLEAAAAVLSAQAPEAAARLRGAADTVVPGFADLIGLRVGDDADDRVSAYEEGTRMSEDEATRFARTLIAENLELG